MHERASLRRPLRIGILVRPAQTFQSWELAVFERILRHPSLTLEAFVIGPRPQPAKSPGPALAALLAIESVLFCRENRLPSADVTAELGTIARLPLADLAHQSGRFDILLSHIPTRDLGFILQHCAQLWEYHFNAQSLASPRYFGFRECLECEPTTTTALVRHVAGGGFGIVAACTTNTKFSAAFNASFAQSALPSLVERELLRHHRSSPAEADNAEHTIALTELQPASAAEVWRYTKNLATYAGRRSLAGALSFLGARPGNWSLHISQGDILDTALDDLVELPQPRGEFRADPFLFRKDGRTYVFYESYLYNEKRGRICAGHIADGEIRGVVPLDLGDAHYSYPYVFEHEGDIFLIPEASANQRVEVWRCTEFPGKWTLHAVALEGMSPADSVLLDWQGDHWLFTNLNSNGYEDHCVELHAFRVDGPDLRQIEPHRHNPVLMDTARARNGGRPFVRDGRLFRPAQVNSHGLYGYGLSLMEVTELSLDCFSESEIRRIEPDREQQTIGCHHLDSCDDMFIIDARRAYGASLLGARPIALKIA